MVALTQDRGLTEVLLVKEFIDFFPPPRGPLRLRHRLEVPISREKRKGPLNLNGIVNYFALAKGDGKRRCGQDGHKQEGPEA
jgi:hypothetical protein